MRSARLQLFRLGRDDHVVSSPLSRSGAFKGLGGRMQISRSIIDDDHAHLAASDIAENPKRILRTGTIARGGSGREADALSAK